MGVRIMCGPDLVVRYNVMMLLEATRLQADAEQSSVRRATALHLRYQDRNPERFEVFGTDRQPID